MQGNAFVGNSSAELTDRERQTFRRIGREVSEAVTNLPPELRGVFRKRAAGQSFEEIAAVSAMSVPRAVSLVEEARRQVNEAVFSPPVVVGLDPADLEDLRSPDASPEEMAVASLEAVRVRRAVAGLPPLERQVIRLRFGLGAPEHSVRQAAARLGMSRSALQRAEQRGLDLLRADMGAAPRARAA